MTNGVSLVLELPGFFLISVFMWVFLCLFKMAVDNLASGFGVFFRTAVFTRL